MTAVTTLLQLATLKLPAPLYLSILSADVSGATASNGVTLFTGEVTKASVKGSRLTANGSPGGSAFDRKLPSFLIGPQCNWSLFSTGCGLSSANWKFTALVKDPGTAGYPFTFELKTLDREMGTDPAYFADFFAGGWVEFGSGSTWQRIPILRSTLPVAAVFIVTLGRDPDPFPAVNDAVVVYPGCDGRAETCRAYQVTTNPEGKFNNYLNFGGHPYVPVGNPSIVRKSDASAAKK